MSNTSYNQVLEAARQSVSQKDLPEVSEKFKDISISKVYVFIFRYVSRGIRKIMRRLKK